MAEEDAGPTLSIIVPCWNEENNIRRHYEDFLLLPQKIAGISAELVLEEDGSADATASLIDELASKNRQISALHGRRRLGKGGGIEYAVANSTGDLIIVSDADLPVGVDCFSKIYDNLKSGADVVLPNRRHRDSMVYDLPFSRKVASKGFNVLVNLLFGLDIRDTQCGVKGFKREHFQKIRPTKYKGYVMDVEMLIKARKNNLNIVDIPVTYRHGKETRFNTARDGYKMFKDIVRMWKERGSI